jgi:hypothetical protein
VIAEEPSLLVSDEDHEHETAGHKVGSREYYTNSAGYKLRNKIGGNESKERLTKT